MKTRQQGVWAGLLSGVVAMLLGCAQVTDVSHLLVATRVNALAVVDGYLLQGEISLRTDRSGTVTLRSALVNPYPIPGSDRPAVASCMGQLRYTSTEAGVIDLRCNNGISTELRFTMLTMTKGHAYGVQPDLPVSMAYGMSFADTKAYLRLPPNKLLVETARGDVELR